MPIMTQKRIYRSDLQNNPNVLYVFGDNVERVGLGGQAAEMRGEPNAIGVATKWKPTMNMDAFFYDRGGVLPHMATEDDAKRIILSDMLPIRLALNTGRTVVLPEDGIGTGLSKLPLYAPRLDRLIKNTFAEMTENYDRYGKTL